MVASSLGCPVQLRLFLGKTHISGHPGLLAESLGVTMVTPPQVARLARLSSHRWRMHWYSPGRLSQKKKKKSHTGILGSGHRDLSVVLLLTEATSYIIHSLQGSACLGLGHRCLPPTPRSFLTIPSDPPCIFPGHHGAIFPSWQSFAEGCALQRAGDRSSWCPRPQPRAFPPPPLPRFGSLSGNRWLSGTSFLRCLPRGSALRLGSGHLFPYPASREGLEGA